MPPGRWERSGSMVYAVGFYRKEGFEVTSEEFLEDGIPHVEMRRALMILPHWMPSRRAEKKASAV